MGFASCGSNATSRPLGLSTLGCERLLGLWTITGLVGEAGVALLPPATGDSSLLSGSSIIKSRKSSEGLMTSEEHRGTGSADSMSPSLMISVPARGKLGSGACSATMVIGVPGGFEASTMHDANGCEGLGEIGRAHV